MIWLPTGTLHYIISAPVCLNILNFNSDLLYEGIVWKMYDAPVTLWLSRRINAPGRIL
jgi:hypothetical protein